ncbi:hypothetical protein NLJ89_g7184 [Agrocybe chaxingu]|uniref:Uncharacterized protein n=1 Tax=Agrocybe chaxingu TaxID=84603 RepID=A0A9W8JXV5_9AGAR|nr:hypothetical protein NLJ89_g7184 [Agrocybe chaxingu]
MMKFHPTPNLPPVRKVHWNHTMETKTPPYFKLLHTLDRATEDTSSCYAVALSVNGRFLACGFASGIVEIKETGSYKTVRIFDTGARVTCIRWHPQIPRHVVVGSQNGNVHAIRLGHKADEDTYRVVELMGYVTDIAFNEDGSQIAVAYAAWVVLVNNPFAERSSRSLEWLPTDVGFTQAEDANDVFFTPLGVHYLDEYTLLIVYIHHASAFQTAHPYGRRWSFESVSRHSWMSRSALSPDRRQLVACSLTDAVERYSIPRQDFLRTHEHSPELSQRGRQNRAFGVAHLNNQAVVVGNNSSNMAIIVDYGRANEGRRRYKFHQFQLNTFDQVTHTVVAGRINGQPIVVAVNGDGQDTMIYIVGVDYALAEPRIAMDIPPVTSLTPRRPFPDPCMLAICVVSVLAVAACYQITAETRTSSALVKEYSVTISKEARAVREDSEVVKQKAVMIHEALARLMSHQTQGTPRTPLVTAEDQSGRKRLELALTHDPSLRDQGCCAACSMLRSRSAMFHNANRVAIAESPLFKELNWTTNAPLFEEKLSQLFLATPAYEFACALDEWECQGVVQSRHSCFRRELRIGESVSYRLANLNEESISNSHVDVGCFAVDLLNYKLLDVLGALLDSGHATIRARKDPAPTFNRRGSPPMKQLRKLGYGQLLPSWHIALQSGISCLKQLRREKDAWTVSLQRSDNILVTLFASMAYWSASAKAAKILRNIFMAAFHVAFLLTGNLDLPEEYSELIEHTSTDCDAVFNHRNIDSELQNTRRLRLPLQAALSISSLYLLLDVDLSRRDIDRGTLLKASAWLDSVDKPLILIEVERLLWTLVIQLALGKESFLALLDKTLVSLEAIDFSEAPEDELRWFEDANESAPSLLPDEAQLTVRVSMASSPSDHFPLGAQRTISIMIFSQTDDPPSETDEQRIMQSMNEPLQDGLTSDISNPPVVNLLSPPPPVEVVEAIHMLHKDWRESSPRPSTTTAMAVGEDNDKRDVENAQESGPRRTSR